MSGKLKRVRGSGNVFRDLGFGKAEAESLKLRAELMMRIDEAFRRSGMTQAEAARALGLTQPRLNALLKGNIGLFQPRCARRHRRPRRPRRAHYREEGGVSFRFEFVR